MEKIDVNYVAKLARLKLNEDEKNKLSEQLTEILEYIKKLNQLDTENVKPTAHVVELKNVFREDISAESKSAGDILSNAPEKEGPYFRVKKVIE